MSYKMLKAINESMENSNLTEIDLRGSMDISKPKSAKILAQIVDQGFCLEKFAWKENTHAKDALVTLNDYEYTSWIDKGMIIIKLDGEN